METLTASQTAAQARERLRAYIAQLPDASAVALARELLDEAAPEEEDEDDDWPLQFTEEEGRARLERAIQDMEEGEKGIPLAEFEVWIERLMQRHV